MFRTKKTLFLIVILMVSALSYAQSIYELDSSIATTDNLFAPVVNPALIGTESPQGIGWAQLIDKKDIQNHYWILANMDGLSYIYEYNNGSNVHNIALGSEMFEPHVFRNLYFGSSYIWNNSSFEEGSFKTGLAYRPHNSASIAMTLDHPYKSSPGYRVGFGIRPFSFVPTINDYRAELTLDLPYHKVDGDYEMLSPTIGLNTQIVDGIRLGANYNLESEAAMLSFSLSPRKIDAGTIARIKDGDNYGIAYVHLTDKSFKPFLGITPKTWYDMKLRGQYVTYRAPKYKVGPFSIYDAKSTSIESLIKEVNKAAKDPAVHGILVQNPSFSASISLLQELIAALKDFKAQGKQLAFYYDNISNGGYIFASSIADKIYLNPNGIIDLRGLAIQSPYFKETLDALGIEVINFRSHDYKTAANMFSEKEMTPAERHVYEELLDSIFAQLVSNMEAGRGEKLAKAVTDIIDEGPYYISSDALNANLVDRLIYLDQLDETLKEDFGHSKKVSGLQDYLDYNWAKPKETQIAVIYAQGNIVMGKGPVGQKIAHETTVEKIRAARKNKNYKGIILRIDSGGGSAQASDIIWRELELAKIENKMPIVVSMTGAAASGGYYIACNADRIVAHPTTITGSIGVVGMVFNAENLFKKVKVNWSTVARGKHSDLGAIHRTWRDDEKEIVTSMIRHSYEDFTSKVAAGRNMPLEQILELAQGRVWTGSQAFENGLVDVLGGMDEAVEEMRTLTGIKGKIRLVDASSSTKKGIPIEMEKNPLSFVLPTDLLESYAHEYLKLYEMWQDYASDSILMLSPMTLEDLSN